MVSPRSFRQSSLPAKSRHKRPADPRLAITRSPSVTQVADPYGLVPCVGSLPVKSTYRDHFSLPVLRSTHRTPRLAPLSVACVRKMWSPQTTGDALPRSGSGDFQRTFSVGPQVSGGSFPGEWPVAAGPRHAGQFSACATVPASRSASERRRRVMGNGGGETGRAERRQPPPAVIVGRLTLRSPIALTFVLDDHDLDNVQGRVPVEVEGLLQVVQELLFLVLDHAVGQDNVAGVGERSLAEALRKALGAAVHKLERALLLEDLHEGVHHRVPLVRGHAFEHSHPLRGGEQALHLLVGDVAVAGAGPEQDAGERLLLGQLATAALLAEQVIEKAHDRTPG